MVKARSTVNTRTASDFDHNRYIKPTCLSRIHDEYLIALNRPRCVSFFFKEFNYRAESNACTALCFIKETRVCRLIR